MPTSKTTKGGSPSQKSEKLTLRQELRDILETGQKTTSQLADLVGASYDRVSNHLRDMESAGQVYKAAVTEGKRGQAMALWAIGSGRSVPVVNDPEAKLVEDVKQNRSKTQAAVQKLLAKGQQTPFGWLLEAAAGRPEYRGD